MVLNLLLVIASAKLFRQNLSHQVILTVSLVDFVCSMFSVTMCCLRIALGQEIFFGTWFCNIFGFTSIGLTCTSALLIGLLGIERYLRVCHERGVPPVLTFVIFMILWVALMVTAAGTSLTNGYLEDPTLVYCLPYGNNWSVAMFVVSKAILGLSLPMLVACYLAVFFFCRRHERDFPAHTRSPRTLIFIIAYCICFIPPMIFIFYESLYGIDYCPRPILILVPIGLSAVPATNPFLVLVLHHQMRANLPGFLRSNESYHMHEPDIKLRFNPISLQNPLP
ncbi:G-protein coupled receptor 87 [Entomophthora muscae]|uniref:G-protein coupled receptor 87 n=1 Tax=Entomophthora muscae TaxID=34485 RepID=A0ACC2SK64_9FUNG|nr:G-protein coupled receptor 87 [Entomophthora muscae]